MKLKSANADLNLCVSCLHHLRIQVGGMGAEVETDACAVLTDTNPVNGANDWAHCSIERLETGRCRPEGISWEAKS